VTATGTGPQPALTPETTVGPPAPRRPARWLDRALGLVDAGPRPFRLAAVVSLAVTSLLAMMIADFVRRPGPLSGSQRHIFAGALVAFCVSAAFGLTTLALRRVRPPAWLDRVIAPRERAAIWLALAAWFPFLLIVVYYRSRATFPHTVHYLYSPFDDKRWETAAFLLGTLAPAVLVITAARVLAVGRDQPPTWRAWFTGLFPRTAAADLGDSAAKQATEAAGNRAAG
jgi:hypothetical protein